MVQLLFIRCLLLLPLFVGVVFLVQYCSDCGGSVVVPYFVMQYVVSFLVL